MRIPAYLGLLCVLGVLGGGSFCDSPAISKAAGHRSPCALALVPGDRYALTANHSADSVSLIDLQAGEVVAEQPCGRRPVAIACSRDGRRAAVSNLWSGTVSLLELEKASFRVSAQVSVGSSPRGLVFAADGNALYVALAGDEEVVRLDWPSRKITGRWAAPREPRLVALSPDGRWLAAASSKSAQVRCWETSTGRLHWEKKIEDGFNLHGLTFSADGRQVICAHVVRREFPVSKENIEEGWVIDSRLSRFPIDSRALPGSYQVALDTRGRAVGDPQSVALSVDGKRLALAGSGTHEVLFFEADSLPWNGGDPGDFLDPRLAKADGKLRRIPIDGRPMALAFLPGQTHVVVANYLLDAVQIVDWQSGAVIRSIPLGPPTTPSLARQGEALFYDAQRSHHQWFSCHTCHVDGHTCGLTFDTLNDDSYGNPKLTPSLRNVSKTGPWTWHGWQKDLGAAIEKSLTQTMYGPPPSREQKQALLAFLGTLEHPPKTMGAWDFSKNERMKQGRDLFHGKARCGRCHQGEEYTSTGVYDVKLEPDGSPYSRWNPPSLRGVSDRGPYLHDGRAKTLEEVLEKWHRPEQLGGQSLTSQERRDLISFLRSL